MDKVNKFMHGLYYNPFLDDYKHMYFFRIERDKLNKLWTLTNKEILLLINIWIYHKEKKLLKLEEETLNTIDFNSKNKKFKIYSSSANIKNHYEKLANLNLINIKNEKFYYNFPKNCKNFVSFPLIKVLHWLENTNKTKGLDTYIYLMLEFYNKYRPSYNKNPSFGVDNLTISHRTIGEKISRAGNTVKAHCDKIYDLGLIDKEDNTGNELTYHLPFYVKNKDTIVAAKTRSKEDIPEKIREKYNIELKGGE